MNASRRAAERVTGGWKFGRALFWVEIFNALSTHLDSGYSVRCLTTRFLFILLDAFSSLGSAMACFIHFVFDNGVYLS